MERVIYQITSKNGTYPNKFFFKQIAPPKPMKQIFLNLPVKDVEASMRFYQQLGFDVNPLFTFDDQKCMVWGEQILLMLQDKEKFKPATNKTMADPKTNTIATFTLPVESLEKMNEMVEKGIKAGGTESTPMRDEGFMQ
jgi:predicted lactoylglutathione lyase